MNQLHYRQCWSFPPEISNAGFPFGHSFLGNADFEVVHFAFEFYGFETYNVLVNPNNPLVRTVLTTMVKPGDYFSFALDSNSSVTAFRSELGETTCADWRPIFRGSERQTLSTGRRYWTGPSLKENTADGGMVKRLRLHLGRIEDELRDVQRHFPAINAVLNCRRDDFSDTVRQNMLTAYEFLDAVVAEKFDLFGDEGIEALLQLNHLVLLGRGYDLRAFDRHITATRRQFFDNFRRYVKPIRRWYRKHETENPYKVASQVYVGILSQPQLYQEGNHRTGSLIASGILLQSGCPPFVLSRQNAVAYFNPSSEIKFADKRTVRGKLRLPKYQQNFREFLERNVNEKYVRRS